MAMSQDEKDELIRQKFREEEDLSKDLREKISVFRSNVFALLQEVNSFYDNSNSKFKQTGYSKFLMLANKAQTLDNKLSALADNLKDYRTNMTSKKGGVVGSDKAVKLLEGKFSILKKNVYDLFDTESIIEEEFYKRSKEKNKNKIKPDKNKIQQEIEDKKLKRLDRLKGIIEKHSKVNYTIKRHQGLAQFVNTKGGGLAKGIMGLPFKAVGGIAKGLLGTDFGDEKRLLGGIAKYSGAKLAYSGLRKGVSWAGNKIESGMSKAHGGIVRGLHGVMSQDRQDGFQSQIDDIENDFSNGVSSPRQNSRNLGSPNISSNNTDSKVDVESIVNPLINSIKSSLDVLSSVMGGIKDNNSKIVESNNLLKQLIEKLNVPTNDESGTGKKSPNRIPFSKMLYEINAVMSEDIKLIKDRFLSVFQEDYNRTDDQNAYYDLVLEQLSNIEEHLKKLKGVGDATKGKSLLGSVGKGALGLLSKLGIPGMIAGAVTAALGIFGPKLLAITSKVLGSIAQAFSKIPLLGKLFSKAGEVTLETGAKVGSKVGTEVAAKGGGKLLASGAKVGSKLGLKTLGRVVPGLMSIYDIYSAYNRFQKGDITGAAIDAGAAIATLAGPLGMGASVALNATNAYRDIKGMSSYNTPNEGKFGGKGTTGSWGEIMPINDNISHINKSDSMDKVLNEFKDWLKRDFIDSLASSIAKNMNQTKSSNGILMQSGGMF